MYWNSENRDPNGEPPWTCPKCKFVNFAFRQHCRNCTVSVDEAFPGEGLLVGAFVINETGVGQQVHNERN